MAKYLVFKLDAERYAMPLSKVKEVINVMPVTNVPHVPDFFNGVINLRGKIISVIDIRMKFHVKNIVYVPKKTSIVISEIGDLTLGAIVDEVIEVKNYEDSEIEKDLDVQNKNVREYVTGVAKNDDYLTVILDMEKTFNVKELERVRV